MGHESTALEVRRSPNVVRIDEIAASAMDLFRGVESFAEELAIAQAIGDMRAALTEEVMKPVMALMNTDLGFRTDRDPKAPGKGERPQPYSLEVVRECFIEAKMRGFHAIGNEWNIISGRFYAAKNGLRRKVTTWPGVVDFRDTYDVPRTVGGASVVKARATWKKDGTSDTLECEIPIRVNDYMGADAVLGKAERKLLKRVHDRLSGVSTPDGDASEEPAPVEERRAPPRTTQAPATPPPPDGAKGPAPSRPPSSTTADTKPARPPVSPATPAFVPDGWTEPGENGRASEKESERIAKRLLDAVYEEDVAAEIPKIQALHPDDQIWVKRDCYFPAKARVKGNRREPPPHERVPGEEG
jgi:hypothetical protein